jgi:putative membrane protein
MMMWHYYDGWTFLWMGAVMLLAWGGVIALVALLVRSQTHSPAGGDQALETLRRRFAAGEITQEEFEARRRVLQS